jgi:hypothetical protein
LSLVGGAIYVDPTTRVIGYEDFYVAVAPSCSGLEGVVLMGSFVGLYGLLFRSDLQLRRYWLIVLPLALVASWIFNVIRVVSLIIIGARLSPEIAVNGFHSYAGWMFFTLTAFTLVFVLHSVPALHRKSVQSTGPRLREDQHAALILPLVVFLVSGVVGSALTIHSDLAFPARAAALAAALWFFWKWYRGLACSPDGVAALAGAAVGLLWIVTESRASQESSLHLALESLGPSLLIVWVVSRIIGAALLVPVAEELFFRGYLLARIDLGGWAGKVLAIVLSSLLFAALHERWIAATAAGIVFALIMLRRGRVGDAILAHIIANSLILLPSLVTGSWATL